MRKPLDNRGLELSALNPQLSTNDQPSTLNSAWEPARLYFRYLGVSLRAQLQYRASFVMLTLGQLVITATEFLAIWAMFARFRSLRGWSLAEVALLYGIVNVAFALGEAFGRGFDVFSDLVKSGDFDRVLLRPRGTAFQLAGQELQLMRVGRLLQGAVVLAWAVARLGLAFSPARLLLLAAAILGGACLFYGLFVLQATLAFWTVETLELANTLTYGGVETAQYPMSIYRPWFRSFFTLVVPLACINFVPAQALLHRQPAMGTAAIWPWLSPLVGVVFLLVCLQIWEVGVRHYRSTGS